MYRCECQITVFGGNPLIESALGLLKPLERFTHKITVKSVLVPEVLKKSDVIIWNLGAAALPSQLRLACKDGAVIIYCAEREAIDRFDCCDLEAVDEFWELPLRKEQVRIRLKRTMEQVKLRYDFCMTQTYLDTAIDSIPDMLWFKSLDGTHVKVNKAFCSVVEKTREDVTGKDHCYIWGVSPEDAETGNAACKESEEAVIKARRTLQFTEAVKCSQGMRQLRTYKTPILDRDGETVLGTVGIGHDVTDIGNMSTEIEILLQSMPYAILLWNSTGKILNANTKFEEYFHTDRDQVIGKDYNEWIADAFEEKRTINSEGYVESKVYSEDGSGKMLEIHENSIYDVFHNMAGKLCIFRDVTVERDLEKQILHSSNTDFLTGLYNRRCFYQFMHNNRSGRKVSLMYIDLDRFKEVNDTYGHKVGDAVLMCAAKILTETFPEDFVARLGGDEFLMVRLGECDCSQLEEEAENLIQRIQKSFSETAQVEYLSASIGIAQSTDEDEDIDLLLQRSDQALYQAKKDGRSCYRVYRETRRDGQRQNE